MSHNARIICLKGMGIMFGAVISINDAINDAIRTIMRMVVISTRYLDLLDKLNKLVRLIIYMAKNNQMLKKKRLLPLKEIFNLYKQIHQNRINHLNLMMIEKLVIQDKVEDTGAMQWQQVFA